MLAEFITKNAKSMQGYKSLIKRAITREEFSDFYALDALAPYLANDTDFVRKLPENIKNKIGDLLQRRNKIIWKIANYYYTSIKKIMIDEFGGAPDNCWPTDEEEKAAKLRSVGFKENIINGYGSEIHAILPSNPHEFTPQQFIVMFENIKFGGSWGGKPWADIARLYKELGELIRSLKSSSGEHEVIRWHLDGTFQVKLNELSSIIDRINQAEHNTGSLFTHFQGVDNEGAWITDALNEKAIPNSIQVLKKRVSPDLKDVVQELQRDSVDQNELALQIAEIQLLKWKNKKIKSINDSAAGSKEYLLRNYKDNYISKEELESELKRLNLNVDRDMQTIDNPDGSRDLELALKYSIGENKENAIVGLYLKNRYIDSFLQFIRANSLYDVDADLVRQALSVFSSSKKEIIDNLMRIRNPITPDQVEVSKLLYSIFLHINMDKAIEHYGNNGIFNALSMFATEGFDMKPFKLIYDRLRFNKYTNWETYPERDSTQLSLDLE